MKSRFRALALAMILAGSLALKLHHLGHAAVKPLDEVFHAIVARNLLKHPLTPTLVDHPFLPYNQRNWLGNHIWLHKPPMALWQIAASFALLGVNTLALRLPSAILSTLAVWLTYLIGKELLDGTAALIAAALQAFNPVILMLVHGYVFSDHVDISLLFWTELAIYFLVRAMRSGTPGSPSPCTQAEGLGNGECMPFTPSHLHTFAPLLALCGIAQGLAFLCKTFPALIVTVLALAIWLLPATRLGRRQDRRLTGRGVLWMLLWTAVAVLPWTIYAAVRFPSEFWYENLQILHHLDENVEGWAAPWDQLVFGYWISIFHVYYPAIIAAALALLPRAYRQKQTGLWIVLAWAIGVMAPNLLATSKPMSATLVGWPAAWLILGYFLSRAVAGDRLALGTWLAAMLLAIFWLGNHAIPIGNEHWGQSPTGLATIMRQHLWVLWHVLIALACGGLLSCLALPATQRRILVGISTAAMLLLGLWCCKGDHPRGYVLVAWDVTQIDAESPNFAALGNFAHALPANAAFIVDEKQRLENKLTEFAADRSCYAQGNYDWRPMARELAGAGALPYLITSAAEALPPVFVDPAEDQTVYACTPAALAAARH